MKPNENTRPVFARVVRPLLVGLCVGVIVCTLLLLLAAALVGAVDVPRQAVMPLAYGAAAVAAFTAGLVTARLSGKNGLLMGAACGLLLYLLVLAAGFVRTTGVDIGLSVLKLAILTVAGGVGGVLGVNRR